MNKNVALEEKYFEELERVWRDAEEDTNKAGWT